MPQKEDFPEDRFGILARNSLSYEECWGIRDRYSFFPSGIYKTPFYNLLWIHPIVGLKFIIDFINYSVEFYVNATCEYKHKISQIEIEQNDGTKTKLYAAWELWAAYRGLSVTNYALESLLMSLEKFLLETAKRKTDVSRENLKFIFDYVLKNSNNVAPIAVLTSVAIAYPGEVEEAMLPLLSVKEFYEWDLSRALQESSVLASMDRRILFAQKERLESNQLPHRKKYQRGLRDFILDYQFNVRKLNKEIHQRIDKLKAQYDGKDVIWKKNLIEMDIRNYKVGEYDEKLGGFLIQPEYDDEVVKFIESNKESFEADTKSLNISGQLSKTYEKKEIVDFSSWLSCYEQYSSSKSLNILYDRPITLAVLGLRDFSTNINEEQKTKCIEIITDAIVSILQDTFNRGYDLNMSINILEKDIALSSFHLLMENVDSEEDKNGIIATMIYMLFAPFHDHEFDKIIRYFREVFFKQFPNEAKRVWLGLITYACYKKTNPKSHRHQDEDSLKEVLDKEEKFVQQISSNKNLKFDLSEISLEKCEGYLLARAFVITPYDTADKDFKDFINHILPIVLGDFTKKEDYSYNRGRESRQFHHESISDIEQYLANLFLDANFDFSKSVLTTLVNSLSKNMQRQRFGRDDLFQFVNTTLDYFVLKLYDNGNLKIDQIKYSQQQTNFWNLWEVLFDLIPSDGTHPLIQKLLLDIRYLLWDYQGNPNENNWSVLNGKKEFYKKIVLEKGKSNASSVINVFSTIGGKEFLPEGISWLADVFKSNPMTSLSLTSVSSDRMIKRLFYNHISKIKNDKKLIDDYIWILNRMVDLGSSEAYLFRENVITYKSIK